MDTTQLADQLSSLSITEILALTKTLEEQWGVKAAPAVSRAMPHTPVEAPPTEQTEFEVVLVAVPMAKKISVIKAIREATSLGLVEAKAFVEGAPRSVKDGLAKVEADALSAKLIEAGAEVQVK